MSCPRYRASGTMRSGNRRYMKILVSNDDGIHAEGLASLCSCLTEAGFQVYVCAPDRERSAASHALTMYSPLRLIEVGNPNFDAFRVWSADGTPADCVKIALELLMKSDPPDYVISGVNRGPNLGTDVLYSGTVAAAAEGCFAGIPSLAVSCTDKMNPNYQTASKFVSAHISDIFANELPQGTMLNINVPADITRQVANTPYMFTRAGTMKYVDIFDVRHDPRGREYIWMSGNPMDLDIEEDFDTVAIKKGLISITPIKFDVTDYSLLAKLRNSSGGHRLL